MLLKFVNKFYTARYMGNCTTAVDDYSLTEVPNEKWDYAPFTMTNLHAFMQ